MFSTLRLLPLLLAALVLAGMALEASSRPRSADADGFHAAAAAAVQAIPTAFDSWEGSEIPVPASAQALLKPNAILSRRYVNKGTGESVSIMLVQCRDTRDMTGHYPPVCYPGQGWTQAADAPIVEFRLPGLLVHARRYEFRRQTFDQQSALSIYDFFAIPGMGIPPDIDAVKECAADYTSRPFGAAQVQIVFGSRYPPARERAIVEAFLARLEPALSVLSDPKWRHR